MEHVFTLPLPPTTNKQNTLPTISTVISIALLNKVKRNKVVVVVLLFDAIFQRVDRSCPRGSGGGGDGGCVCGIHSIHHHLRSALLN